MICPFLKRDRYGDEWLCGSKTGKCEKKYDIRIDCEIRNGSKSPAGSA